MPAPMTPRLGDWLCLPQSVALVDRHAPSTKEHRWIVASHLRYRMEFPVILRTTKSGYGGTHHPPHRSRCGVDGCRIDEYGWISDERTDNVPVSEFTLGRWSCREPDEEVRALAMETLEKVHRARARRHRGRRRRR